MFDPRRVEQLFHVGVERQTSTAGGTILSDLTVMIDEALKTAANFGPVRDCVLRLLAEVKQSDAAGARHFCALVAGSQFNPDAIAEAIRDRISDLSNKPETLPVRVELVRLLAGTTRAYQPAELDAEQEFHDQFPWEWIDCMARVDAFRASAEIADIILYGGIQQTRHNVQMLLWRLPRLTRALNGDTPTWARIWINSVRVPEYRDQLVTWFMTRGYAVRPPLEEQQSEPVTWTWRGRDPSRSQVRERADVAIADLPPDASQFLKNAFTKHCKLDDYRADLVSEHDQLAIAGVKK